MSYQAVKIKETSKSYQEHFKLSDGKLIPFRPRHEEICEVVKIKTWIKKELLKQAEMGSYALHLPSVLNISFMFFCPYGTVLEALNELTHEGYGYEFVNLKGLVFVWDDLASPHGTVLPLYRELEAISA